jgi:hypothetical protein
MAFTLAKGPAKVEWYPAATSQAFSYGDLVYFNASGKLIPADATSGDHAGVIMRAITSASDAYTTEEFVPVIVPQDDTEFEVDVDTGTALTTAMVGNRYDLTDANSLNVGGTSKKVVTITKFISATKALVKINAMIQNADVATT